MRELKDHIVEGDLPQNQLKIEVTDEPGAGGANYQYEIIVPYPSGNHEHYVINFQNGPIQEVGVNGITQEALLAIVIDRLRSFQDGPFACVSNQTALIKCKEALNALKFRTENRLARGVEGKMEA